MSALYVSLHSKTLSYERVIDMILDLGPKASVQLIKMVNGKIATNKRNVGVYLFMNDVTLYNVC